MKEAKPDNAVLQIKSLEAFAKAADGKATKIIIPSEIQGIEMCIRDSYESQGIDRKEAMKLVAKDRGVSKRDIYRQLL